jgi:hypothetical protein
LAKENLSQHGLKWYSIGKIIQERKNEFKVRKQLALLYDFLAIQQNWYREIRKLLTFQVKNS